MYVYRTYMFRVYKFDSYLCRPSKCISTRRVIHPANQSQLTRVADTVSILPETVLPILNKPIPLSG